MTTLSAAATPYQWDGVAIDSANDIYGSGSSAALASVSPALFGASIYERTASGALASPYPNWESSPSPNVASGGLVFDSKGNLFLADVINNRIVKFTPPTGWTVFAGNGTAGNADGIGSAATLTLTSNNLGIDANDNLYVRSPSVFRKIAPDASVTTITPPTLMTGAGFTVDAAGDIFTVDVQTIYRMSVGGTVAAYPFAAPSGVVTSLAIDKNNNLYAGTQGAGAQILKISF